MRFRSKERGTIVKDRAKNGASKRPRRGWGRKEETFPSPLLFFGSRFISREAKTVPWSFFTPKPNGNASYTGYCYADAGIKLSAKASKLSKLVRYKCHDNTRLGSLFVSWKGVIFQRKLHNLSYYRGICTCVRRFSSRVLHQIVRFSFEIAPCQELF